MDSRWFKEDREEARKDGTKTETELKRESEKALKNSTLFQRRLSRILMEELEKTLRDDEDFSKPNWEREHVANIARRKALKDVINLVKI